MTREETLPRENGVYMRSTTYRIVHNVVAALGSKPTRLGTAGSCRYCHTNDPKRFRKEAHTLAEGLGNKWVFSLDECDDCNNRFSRYEGALTASVGALLTLGGVKGKGNSVRQTGRSAGPAYVEHSIHDGSRSLFAMINGLDAQLGRNPRTGAMRFTFPIANERFRPVDAYKAVLKIGYALLPDDERAHYERLRCALSDPNTAVGDGPQAVGLSFAMVGNAPPFVSATLVRRCADGLPKTLLVVAAGSVCLITQLRSDGEVEPVVPLSKVGLRWTTHLGSLTSSDAVSFQYSAPLYLDWSSAETIMQPIESMTLEFDPVTTIGSFTPTFRESSPIL